MPDTETLTPDQVSKIADTVTDNAPLQRYLAEFGIDILALCRSLRAARADLKQGALCEECDQWENDQDGNPRTFMVCGACWNESQKTITALRTQNQTQRESIITLQENEKSLKAQLVEVEQERTRVINACTEKAAEWDRVSWLGDEYAAAKRDALLELAKKLENP